MNWWETGLIPIGRGMLDIYQGGKDLALRGGESLGLLDPGTSEDYRNQVNDEMAIYQSFAEKHPVADIAGRMAGNLAALPVPGAMGAGLGAKALSAGAMGAGSGLIGYAPTMAERATSAALGGATGPVMEGAPIARKIFAGPKSQGAPLEELDQAKGLLAEGVDEGEVWSKTGWWVNTPDGVPRYEIPDQYAKVDFERMPVTPDPLAQSNAALYGDAEELKALLVEAPDVREAVKSFQSRHGRLPQKNALKVAENTSMPDIIQAKAYNSGLVYSAPRTGTLGEQVQNVPEVFSAYPEMAEAPLTVRGLERAHGVYQKGNYLLNRKLKGRERASTALHEMQHGIQAIEGMMRGGSPSSAPKTFNPKWRRWQSVQHTPENKRFMSLYQSSEYQKEVARSNAVWRQEWQPRIDALEKQADSLGRGAGREKRRAIYDQIDKMFADFKKYKEKAFPVITEVDELAKSPRVGVREPSKYMTPEEAYRHLGGEAEARAVQARQNLTPRQRRQTPPWESYDLPIEDLLVVR